MTINGLACKMIGRKGRKAILVIEGQEVLVPAESLPAKTQDGDEVRVRFLNSQEAKLQETSLAKEILDEILNGGK